jgi:hypothetical protein
MSERPIFLDARDLAGRAFAEQRQDDAGRSGGLSSGTPSDQDQSRFRQAVSAGAQSLEPAAAERNESDAIASRPASAFELFGRVSETVDRRGESGQASLTPLCATIDRFVRRMTLSDGQDGRRGLNIDLDLEGDAIPGVTLSVLRDAGAWLAEFQQATRVLSSAGGVGRRDGRKAGPGTSVRCGLASPRARGHCPF